MKSRRYLGRTHVKKYTHHTTTAVVIAITTGRAHDRSCSLARAYRKYKIDTTSTMAVVFVHTSATIANPVATARHHPPAAALPASHSPSTHQKTDAGSSSAMRSKT